MLEADQQLIKQYKWGSIALSDLLVWLEVQAKRTTTALAQKACEEHLTGKALFVGVHTHEAAINCIIDEFNRLQRLSGQPPYIIVFTDYNVPHARDAVKVEKFAGVAAQALALCRSKIQICLARIAFVLKSNCYHSATHVVSSLNLPVFVTALF
jgi:hypothetical protein